MDSRQFEEMAKAAVAGYYNELVRKDDEEDITEENVIVVWGSKILQNNKAMLITDRKDGNYYEVTYNGEKDEFYLDWYAKADNILIPVERV